MFNLAKGLEFLANGDSGNAERRFVRAVVFASVAKEFDGSPPPSQLAEPDTMTIEPFCECERPRPNDEAKCLTCDRVIECEFSELSGKPHPATMRHIDYAVCAEHLDAAIENVHSRTAL